jgi:hypothetical protein
MRNPARYLQSLAGGEGNAQLIIDGFEGGRTDPRSVHRSSSNRIRSTPMARGAHHDHFKTGRSHKMGGQYELPLSGFGNQFRTPGTTNKPVSRRHQVDLSTTVPSSRKAGHDLQYLKTQSDSGDNYIKAITPSGLSAWHIRIRRRRIVWVSLRTFTCRKAHVE